MFNYFLKFLDNFEISMTANQRNRSISNRRCYFRIGVDEVWENLSWEGRDRPNKFNLKKEPLPTSDTETIGENR